MSSSPSTTHTDGVAGSIMPTTTATDATLPVLLKDSVPGLPDEFYQPFLSHSAVKRKVEPIRSLLPLEKFPGVISLLAGKPHESTFPITSLQFTTVNPLTSEQVQLVLSEEELSEGLQYSATAGISELIEWVYGLQEARHGRSRSEGWMISIGAGSQDLIYKAAHTILDPGDTILIEAPVYAGVITIFEQLDCEMIEVGTDACGIKSHNLRTVLENWPAGKPKPKMLYTVPYGSNPSGTTATLERRREVLELAREHNFLIFEDDPYFYLYYGDVPRPPSYFSLEKQCGSIGRVVRFDSFSKVLSSGIRIGFVSAPQRLLHIIDRHTASANLQPNSLTQILALKVLSSWGYDGFQAHTDRVAEFYRQKRDTFERAMQRHMKGLAEWDLPEAGMFFWFKLLLGEGEHAGDSEHLIRGKAFDNGVLALPGTIFSPNGARTAYVRASFSQLAEPDVDEALKRLADVIRQARYTN